MNMVEVAQQLRTDLSTKKCVLLFAYNGTGKTRVSMEFKNLNRAGDSRDTLYFNAFTEDLFYWDNDLRNDTARKLKINDTSRFFLGLRELEMENRIRPFLHRYVDFDFKIDYELWEVVFFRDGSDNIKVSRGEENIFIWCFFLAIVQLAIDQQAMYNWVKYIYVDDPISSLDDNNAIEVASHLAILIKRQSIVKVVISSHHTLFFNVMYNELSNAKSYFLHKNANEYVLQDTSETPSFYHIGMLKKLHELSNTGQLYTYHFNILRSVLEKTAIFHGFNNFSACIKQDEDDVDGIIHTRIINILSHDKYSVFEPMIMGDENKKYFRKILRDLMGNYKFNSSLFPHLPDESTQS